MKLSHAILFSTALSLVSISPSFSMEPEGQNPNTPVKKSLGLVPHTFNVDGKDVEVQLAYKYSKIDPTKTRFFFEGEVVLIDPETSIFESYVTSPLLPCLLGRIYDPTSGKSLVFHKYATHGMATLQPFYEKLGVTDPRQLNVSLYSCALSEQQFNSYHKAQYYGGKTQIQEMNVVRDFLRDNFKIPEDNIERRYFRNFLTLPNLEAYQQTPTTVGVTKTGELFHTSLVMEDIFGLENVKLPYDLKKHKTFSKLPGHIKSNLAMAFAAKVMCPSVRNHFVGASSSCNYGALKFFASEELNIPASSLPQKFNLKYGARGLVEGDNPFK